MALTDEDRAKGRVVNAERRRYRSVQTESMRNTSRRADFELIAAQRALAATVFDHPDLTDDEVALRYELSEALAALGLLQRFTGYAPRRVLVTCDGATGTLRGYRLHLRAYDTPCRPCLRARRRELDERWKCMGISSGEVVLPT